MNEEMEYAEMLEIPVSTVNVVKKKNKRKDKKELQASLISQINEKIEQDKRDFSRIENIETAEDDGVQTVVLERAPVPMKNAKNVENALLKAEFALACALCGGIFLTNVFMPNSAINVFFRSLGGAQEQTMEKRYDEFALASVLGENSDVEITLSPTGVLTFTQKGFVYPAHNGTVANVDRSQDGTYQITVDYSSDFCGVFSGLSTVYYQAGESVKANIPVGYSGGETGVSVRLYSDGELLNCFTLDDENKPTWIEND